MSKKKLAQPNFSEAGNYDQISSIESEDGLHLIDLATVAKGSKVLDLGCGTGFLAKVLADLLGPKGQVVAIDLDTKRLTVASRKNTANNLSFVEGSAEVIPGRDYDLIFSNHVLHWCRDRSLIFSQISSSLKPGGRVACTNAVESLHCDDKFHFLNSKCKEKMIANQASLLDKN